MKHATNCKFCKRPITVEVEDAYAELGDPFKLIQLLCCDHCADLRIERRKLERDIKNKCVGMFQVGPKKAKLKEKENREFLKYTTQKYAELIARWHEKEGMAWDDAIVDTLIENPERWSTVLASMWVHFRKSLTIID